MPAGHLAEIRMVYPEFTIYLEVESTDPVIRAAVQHIRRREEQRIGRVEPSADVHCPAGIRLDRTQPIRGLAALRGFLPQQRTAYD